MNRLKCIFVFQLRSQSVFSILRKKVQSRTVKIFISEMKLLKFNFHVSVFFEFIKTVFSFCTNFLSNLKRHSKCMFSSSNPNCKIFFLKLALEIFESWFFWNKVLQHKSFSFTSKMKLLKFNFRIFNFLEFIKTVFFPVIFQNIIEKRLNFSGNFREIFMWWTKTYCHFIFHYFCEY